MQSLLFLPHDWKLYIAFQEYDQFNIKMIHEGSEGHRIVRSLAIPTRHPPYQTRYEILRRWYDEADVWINLDDDMEILPTVDYDAMAAKVLEPGVGVVSGNWVKSEGHLHRAVYRPEFIEQPIVNMAGGMAYSQEMAKVILAAPNLPYLFCDVQLALEAYVSGRVNYRYRGSLIIHRIMSKGGLKTSYAQRNFELPPSHLMMVKPCTEVYKGTNNNWYMPDSKNLTDDAHRLHRQRRAVLLDEPREA